MFASEPSYKLPVIPTQFLSTRQDHTYSCRQLHIAERSDPLAHHTAFQAIFLGDSFLAPGRIIILLSTYHVMYLSQPRDLMTSMSAGCSRSTTFLPIPDSLAPLPPFQSDNLNDNRRSVDLDSYSLQSPPEGDYDPMHEFSPTRFVHPATLVSPDPYAHAMTTSEGRSMSRLFRSQHFQEVWDKLDPGSVETRPPHPYTELIKLCILKRHEGKLTLIQLYHDLEAKFPHFAASPKGAGWKVSITAPLLNHFSLSCSIKPLTRRFSSPPQNTLRHNLSTQPYFIKLEREHGQLGKGHYWAYCPDLEKPTSLAQSSLVQLTSLWPPSASSSSLSPRDEGTRTLSSATEFQRGPEPYRRHGEASSLPRYRVAEGTRESYDLPNSYRRSMHEHHRVGVPRTTFSSFHARRLSSPVRNLRPLEDREMRTVSSRITRLRSATISTLSRPSPVALTPPAGYEHRRPSLHYPSSSSSISPYAEDLDRDDDELMRPSLPDLPAAPARSLSDWYLNNPIPRRMSSASSAGSSAHSRHARSSTPRAFQSFMLPET